MPIKLMKRLCNSADFVKRKAYFCSLFAAARKKLAVVDGMRESEGMRRSRRTINACFRNVA